LRLTERVRENKGRCLDSAGQATVTALFGNISSEP
jgi:hypothetical protein